MSKRNILLDSLQALLPKQTLQPILNKYNYCDTARKLTVYEFLKFNILASVHQWESYRESEDQLRSQSELPSVDHSTLAKKAKRLPFVVFKGLFHHLVSRCNRRTRRILKLPVPAFAKDTTTVTVGLQKLPWAVFHGQRSGMKLHVELELASEMPSHVNESTARTHDSLFADSNLSTIGIHVYDRGYLKLARLDEWEENRHCFIIRLKENTVLSKKKGLKRWVDESSNVIDDQSVILGSNAKTKHRFRVVTFVDESNRPIRVVTNLWSVSAKTIAALYQARWRIELFSVGSSNICRHHWLTFFRKFLLRQLLAEAEILLCELLYRYRSFW